MTMGAPSARVLLVEDEPGLVLTISDRLKSEGYEVGVAQDQPLGFTLATQNRWDLMLLDVMLPGGSGFDLVRDIRDRGVDTPIIMLTARGEIVDRVLGLKLGADDYLTKPFSYIVLAARLRALLRRGAVPRPAELQAGDLSLDPASKRVRRGATDSSCSSTSSNTQTRRSHARNC